MKRWDELTDEEQRELVRGWTGEIREDRLCEAGTVTMVDLNAIADSFTWAPRAPAVGPRPKLPRKVMFVASDVWKAMQVLRPAEGSA